MSNQPAKFTFALPQTAKKKQIYDLDSPVPNPSGTQREKSNRCSTRSTGSLQCYRASANCSMRNKYRLSDDGNCYEIYFLDGSFFLIDAADLPAVSRYTWCSGKRGYPIAHTSRRNNEGHKTIALHRYLLKPGPRYDIDHISGDKLDNRRANLRVCTHQQNMFNQKMRRTNTSGFYGVSRVKNTGRYEAYIHYDGEKKYLGTYKTAEEAASARDKAAVRFFGAFARLNKNLGVAVCDG